MNKGIIIITVGERKTFYTPTSEQLPTSGVPLSCLVGMNQTIDMVYDDDEKEFRNKKRNITIPLYENKLMSSNGTMLTQILSSKNVVPSVIGWRYKIKL